MIASIVAVFPAIAVVLLPAADKGGGNFWGFNLLTQVTELTTIIGYKFRVHLFDPFGSFLDSWREQVYLDCSFFVLF